MRSENDMNPCRDWGFFSNVQLGGFWAEEEGDLTRINRSPLAVCGSLGGSQEIREEAPALSSVEAEDGGREVGGS